MNNKELVRDVSIASRVFNHIKPLSEILPLCHTVHLNT